MKPRHWLLLPVLLLLAACAGGDKFPYPPQFVDVPAVAPTVLAAPSADGSKAQKREIATILARQARMSDADKAAIIAEDHITPSMIITPVLGARYSQATHPKLHTLLGHAASDAWRISDTTQDYWKRTRPWLVNSQVKLYPKAITRPSYPSGHSTTNHVWAHVLSELFPAKREALFARAHAIGMHRSLGGVHYPSDVEAGKKLAAVIYGKMQKHPQFRAEILAARDELKAPVAANDNTPRAAGCMTPKAGKTMTVCY